MGSFSIWHWLIVLVIVALIFGTKKLRNMGEDLGGAVKGFNLGAMMRKVESAFLDASAGWVFNPDNPGARCLQRRYKTILL